MNVLLNAVYLKTIEKTYLAKKIPIQKKNQNFSKKFLGRKPHLQQNIFLRNSEIYKMFINHRATLFREMAKIDKAVFELQKNYLMHSEIVKF